MKDKNQDLVGSPYNPRPRNDFEKRLFRGFEKLVSVEATKKERCKPQKPNLRVVDFSLWQDD